PFQWVPDLLPFSPRSADRGMQHAIAAVIIGFIPLPILAWLQSHTIHPALHEAMLRDAAACARYLVAAPTLAYAGVVVLPRLARVVSEFVSRGLIREEDQARYMALVDRTRRLILNRWVDLVLIALAYTMSVAFSPTQYPPHMATWVSTPVGN